MKVEFALKNFRSGTMELIQKCNAILEGYAAQGFDMTLRQLYYQLVQANEIPNNKREYDRLGDTVNNARLAGLIDWAHIVDRTRKLETLATWESPNEVIDAVSRQYRIDKWKGQTFRPEVWIEKQALAGVFERVCTEVEVPVFSCRGFPSCTAMFDASERFQSYLQKGQTPYILHFGDHDPSGVDMTRDIIDRLRTFKTSPKIERLALNIGQVEAYQPPPNFCKLSDSRSKAYIQKFGRESWELDALQPDVLSALVRDEIENLIDTDVWAAAAAREMEQVEVLRKISDRFDDVMAFLAA